MLALMLSFKFLRQLSPSPFDGFQTGCEFSGFPVEIGNLLLELFLVQVVQPTLISDERFDFVPQQPIPGVAVHVGFTELQLACSDGCDDLFLGQTELLSSRLVAHCGPLLGPHGIALGHISFLRNALPTELALERQFAGMNVLATFS
jgi:hypothetical protein